MMKFYNEKHNQTFAQNPICALKDIIHAGKILETSSRKLSPYFVPKVLLNMASGQMSIRYGFKGPAVAPSTACAAGSHAIGEAFNLIRLNYADIMLAGGTEASISPMAVAGFSRMKALSKVNDKSVFEGSFWVYVILFIFSIFV